MTSLMHPYKGNRQTNVGDKYSQREEGPAGEVNTVKGKKDQRGGKYSQREERPAGEVNIVKGKKDTIY